MAMYTRMVSKISVARLKQLTHFDSWSVWRACVLHYCWNGMHMWIVLRLLFSEMVIHFVVYIFFKLTWQLPIIYTIITWSSQTFYFENLWFICVSCFFRIVSNMLEPLIACVVLGFENLPESKRKIGINIKVDQRSSKYTEGDEYQ